MKNDALAKKTLDAEYTRRYNRMFFNHALGLLPFAVFVAVTLVQSQALVWPAAYLSGVCYIAVLLCLRILWRRDVTAALRRENLADADYRPPRW